jgi:hypothetical protein
MAGQDRLRRFGEGRWTSAIGTELPIRDVGASVAIGRKADPRETTFDKLDYEYISQAV